MLACVDGALDVAYAFALVVALWANGLAVGLAHRRDALLAPLRRPRLLGAVIAVDVVAVPLLVWALVRALSVPGDYAVGLVLVGIASAGPLGIAVTQLARGDVATAAALVVVLELVNLAAIPLWALALLPEGTGVPVLRMVVTLLALVVVPIAAGMAWRARSTPSATRAVKPFRTVSFGALAAVVTIVLARDGDALGETLDERVPLVAVLALVGSFALGWAAGGRAGRHTRIATALVTAVRASGPALAIAATSFADRPGTRLAIVVFALVSIAGSSLAAVVLSRSDTAERLPGALEQD